MTNVRIVLLALLCGLCVRQVAVAQESVQYREYALGSSLASVLKTSGVSEKELRTLHQRPARIQRLEWRAPYGQGGRERPDSVREIRFSFYDDQLYQIVVTYDRGRIEGLTDDDIIEALSATYGATVLRSTPVTTARPSRPNVPNDTAIVAQWDGPAALLTLTRAVYSPEVQFLLVSKALDERARAAIAEALRLDTLEAPERERARLTKQTEDAQTAAEKARTANKPGFQP